MSELFSYFDDMLDYFQSPAHTGSLYEQEHGLEPHYVWGQLRSENFGTITYTTDDGRVALIWCFRLGSGGWAYVYPPDDVLQYFYIHAREHIAAVLENNKKKYKVESMNEQTNEIDWTKFQNTFLRVEPGTSVDVLLTNWRQANKSFKEQDPRIALIFDVLRVGDVEYRPTLEWSTTSPALAQEFKAIIERAKREGKQSIFVRLKRGSDKRYMVVSLDR